MNKQIVTLVLVVLLGIGAGVLIVAKQEKSAGTSSQTKDSTLQSIKELRQAIDLLTVEIQALRAAIPAKPSNNDAARANQPTEDYTTVHKIEVGHSTLIGKQDAPITIVEFMDFQCPYCGRFHPPVEEIVKLYPDQVNYMIKNYPLPFHPQAKPAAKAAFAAGEQGKYAEMASLIVKNQTNLNDETYKNLAQQLGLDVEKFLKDLKDKDAQWEDYINKDIELGAKIGVRGTPTFFINGKKTRARVVEDYKKEIDAILKK